ncbi:Na+/H+ antiporter subunit D [Paenibacillaceae bacterium]|nr:Na+/H+ antiporter subunit D [Paenibacillaceae bacterium]
MNNLIVMPLLLPLLTAVILVFFYKNVTIQRWISTVSAVSNTALAAYLVYRVHHDGILTLNMGGWAAPYGIVFVADMFSVLLVLAATIVITCCLLYSFRTIGEERERFFYYPLFNFLAVGIIGSFLTGDMFNLFVCFEVMLMSSYGLIVLGGTKRQLRESIKYILTNVISSTLFVVAMAYLYGVLGTLNLAHLSLLVAEAGQTGILTIISALFLIVFGLKAGLLLFFWMPGSYNAPPSPVMALFSGLLTKVGMYAIIRTFTLIFYHEPTITHTLIAWMAVATSILGVAGAVAYRDVNRIMIYNIVAGVGFTMFGLSVANKAALEGVIYYLMHDMIVKALLFMLGGALIMVAGTVKVYEMGGLKRRYPTLGWMFFVTSLALVGVPPLSGFIGKLLIVQGGFESGKYLLTAIALGSSLLVLYSMMKIFMNSFWGAEKRDYPEGVKVGGVLLPSGILLVTAIMLGLFAESLYPLVSSAAEVLLNPQLYIQAVLKE